MNIENRLKKRETVAIIGSVSSFIIFAILLALSNLSTDSFVNMQSYLIKSMLAGSAENTLSAFFNLISPLFILFFAVLFLVLGFVFVSSFGVYETKRNTGLIIGIIGMTAVIVMLRFSILSIFLGIAILCSVFLIMNISNTYFKELKRWKFFRTGSHSIAKALIVINILVALGIFIAISINLSAYQQSFRKEMSSTIGDMVVNEMSGFSAVPENMRSAMTEQIRAQIENEVIPNSPLFNAYIIWLPILTALSVWVILEFTRTLIYSNLAGAFSVVLIRMNEKLE